jgi:r-opsin
MLPSTGKATSLILFCWVYAIGWSLTPFFGWGKYIPEGILDSCSFDYLTRDTMVCYTFHLQLRIKNK